MAQPASVDNANDGSATYVLQSLTMPTVGRTTEYKGATMGDVDVYTGLPIPANLPKIRTRSRRMNWEQRGRPHWRNGKCVTVKAGNTPKVVKAEYQVERISDAEYKQIMSRIAE